MSESHDDYELPKDDRDWIELLRGREAPGSDAGTAAEARLLRRAIRSEQTEDRAADHGLEPLLFRLRREGLLDGARRRLPAFYAAAAAVLVVVIALPIVLQLQRVDENAIHPPAPLERPATRRADDDASYRTRSLAGPSVTVIAADPERTARELRQALRAAGAEVTTSAGEGRFRLAVAVPPEHHEAVRNALMRFDIEAVPAARFRIEVTREGGP